MKKKRKKKINKAKKKNIKKFGKNKKKFLVGTGEAPLNQENGDPVSDFLYTSNFGESLP